MLALCMFSPSCRLDLNGKHTYIIFTNDTEDVIVTDWGKPHNDFTINWLLHNWTSNQGLITPPHITSYTAISNRNTFEEYFDYQFDTLCVYIFKKYGLQQINNHSINCINYTILTCTKADLDENDWTIVYPDMFENYHGQIKQYCILSIKGIKQ